MPAPPVITFVAFEIVCALIETRKHWSSDELVTLLKRMPNFPAPNPELKDNKNILGQTEDEFWAAVERDEHREKLL